MARKKIIAGIDIGTCKISAVVGEVIGDEVHHYRVQLAALLWRQKRLHYQYGQHGGLHQAGHEAGPADGAQRYSRGSRGHLRQPYHGVWQTAASCR